jgi:hypothetical protein
MSDTSPRMRRVTVQLLEGLDDGSIDPKKLAKDLLGYMSEADVADFAESEGYVDEDEDEDEDEDDEDEDEPTGMDEG